MPENITAKTIRSRKGSDRKITALTAYDATFARLIDSAGIDIILVGDSAGMVVAGHSTTLPVTMGDMLYHVKAVRRGLNNAMLVADMPFGSYQVSVDQGMENAFKFMKEGGAKAVKLEGGQRTAELVKRLTESGVPVMGHLGLTPQSINEFGGYQTRATSKDTEENLLRDAESLEEAGVFALVLEKIPAEVAQKVTEHLSVPTIGIGAGRHCDGQVLVLYDMLGMYEQVRPRFVRRYAELGSEIRSAVSDYIRDIQSGSFPGEEESY